MILIEVWREGARQVKEFADDVRITIGRRSAADVCLPSDFVSSEHAFVYRDKGQLYLEATGTNPTWLDGQRVPEGEPVPITPGSVIAIRDFKVHVLETRQPVPDSLEDVQKRCADEERDLYEKTIQGIDFRRVDLLPDQITKEGCDLLRGSFEAAYGERAERLCADAALCRLILARLFQHQVARLLVKDTDKNAIAGKKSGDVELPLEVQLKDPEVSNLLNTLIGLLKERADQRDEASSGKLGLEGIIGQWDDSIIRRIEARVSRDMQRALLKEELFRRIVNLSFGLGPLQDLLEMPGISEILIVGPNRIYVEVGGRLRMTGDSFPSAATSRRILERAVSRAGRRIDMSQPLVDLQLEDGSRMNAVIHPLSRSGDVLSIRKFRALPYTLQDLVENGTMSGTLARFLAAAVSARKNVLIAGGTGSGKTTLLGALATQVNPQERLVLIEDTAEIRLPPEMHVVCLQARPPSIEGKGEVTIRQLVRNALRMRPDRLIVGESRGGEVVDMLQAMNTGHPGSFTTVHANSAPEAVTRLEMMVLQGVELPVRAIRWQIAAAVDVIVQLGRNPSGGRQVLEVAEVAGYDERAERVQVVPIFTLDAGVTPSRYRFTGWLPTFISDLMKSGRFSLEECLV